MFLIPNFTTLSVFGFAFLSSKENANFVGQNQGKPWTDKIVTMMSAVIIGAEKKFSPS